MAKKALAILALLVMFSSPGFAQSPQSSGYEQSKPKRGMTMRSVEANFGSPSAKRSAIGDPPITRWEYQGFTVYFEHDRVIHAVNNRS